MNRRKVFASKWQALMISMCAVFACALFSLGYVLFALPSSAYGANGDTPAVETEKAADPLPRREYTRLEVTKADGLVIYLGKTTAKDLKSNITVIGTFSTGNGNATAVLDDSEYMISQNDALIADNSIIHTVKEGETAPEFFNGEITCGKISANISVAYRTEVPSYTSLAVSLPDGINIDNTFDENTVKKLLIITGTVTEGEGETATEKTEVVNKELVDISVSGSFVANGTITVVATLKSDGTVKSEATDFTVKAAVIKGFMASVKSGVTLVDGIWTKADGYHAFVASESTTPESVLANLDIYAVYENTVKPIYQNGSSTGAVNYTCAITNSSFTAGAQTVEIAVRNDTGVSVGQASISLAFESRRLLKIEATHTKTDATSSSAMDARDFTVTGTYNDGTSAGTLRTDEYTFSPDTYAPSAENLKNLVDNTYTKVIRIISSSNSDIYVDVTTKPITYENIASILMLDGNIATQQVGKPVNFDGLYANVMYANYSFRRIYLSEYIGKTTADGKPYLEYELRKGTTPVLSYTDENQLIPTTDADILWIKFNYYNPEGILVQSSERPFETGEILRADVEIPRLNVTSIAFSAGCSKQISGIDFGNVPFDMTLSITSLGGGSESISATYTKGSSPVLTPNDKVGATFNALSGEITFLRGDTFTVTVRLNDENYRWVNTSGSSASIEGDDIVRYTIVINKAELNVQLDSKTIDLTYGDLIDVNGNTAFSGWTDKVEYSIMGSANVIDKNDANRPEFELLYVGFTDVDGKYTALNNVTSIDAKTLGVGSYKVLVRTIENDAYLASTTLDGNATTITVKAKAITLSGAVKTETYSRQGWDLSHFVNPTSNDLVYNQQFTDIATFAAKTPISPALVDGKYYHAGTYGVTFTLTSKNYVWKDDETSASQDTTFEIKKASFNFNASVANGNYQYTGTPAPSYNTPSVFYPTVNDTYEIYLATDYDAANKKPSAGAVNQLTKYAEDALPVGNYYVHYTTALGSGDLATDYDLPTAYAAFTVTEKVINRLTVYKDGAIYNNDAVYTGSNQEFTLFGYQDFMSVAEVANDVATLVIDVSSGCKLTVLHAATYQVEIKLTNLNYIWADSNGYPDNKDDYTLSFTIKPLSINVTDKNDLSGNLTYRLDLDGTLHTVPAFETADSVALGDKIVIGYSIADKKGNAITESQLKTNGIGTYTLTLFIDGYAYPDDYAFSQPQYTLTVIAAELVLPTLNKSSITYDGKSYAPADLFTHDYMNVLVFTIDGKEFNGIRNAATYKILVKPADNYSWAAGQIHNGQPVGATGAVEFTFVIEQASAVFTWSNTSVTYDGSKQTAVAKLNNGFGDDNAVTVTVGIKNSAADVAHTDGKTDAGNYIAFALQLSGEGSANYKIEQSGGTYQTAFVINKQFIVLPELSKTTTFDETKLNVALDYANALTDKGWAWLVNSANTYPKVSASISGLSLDGNNSSVSDAVFTAGEFSYKYAGKYTLTLTIGDFNNYGWVGQDEQYIEIEVTVDRQAIKTPSISDTYEYDYNDRNVSLTDNSGKGWTWLANQNDAYAKIAASAAYNGGSALSGAVNLADGIFVYENAGEYNITFTIGSALNYFWVDDSGNAISGNSATVTVVVERQKITVPGFERFYTEYDESNGSNMPAMTADLPNMAGLYVQYGNVNITRPDNVPVFDSYAVGSDNCTSKVRGEYYVYFGLKNGVDGVAGGNINNYIFVDPYNGGSVPDYVSRIVYITPEGTGIYLHYAITNAMVEVQFENINYVFGQNFSGTSQKTLEGQLKVSNGNDARKQLAQEMIAGRVTITLTFTNKKGSDRAVYVWTKTGTTSYDINAAVTTLPWDCGTFALTDGSADMANNLPKHAGSYNLNVRFDYGELSDFQTPSTDVSVTVEALQVVINWGDEWSGDYDGNVHAYTPQVTNAPDGANGFTLEVQITKGGSVVDEAKNAGTYVFAVSGIGGAPSGMSTTDFTVVGSNTQTLVINKKAVTVTANGGASHIYGNAFENNGWDDGNGFVASEKALIEFEYFYTDGSGNLVYGTDRNGSSKNNLLVNAGTDYQINFKATGGIDFDNYDLSYVAGSYAIEQRALTVTVKNNISSVYGEELKTSIDDLCTVSGIADGETATLFTLKIYESANKQLNKYSPIGSYTITLEDANANYNVTFNDANKYTITAADLKVKVNVTLYYGEQFDNTFKTDSKYLYEKADASKRNVGIYTVSGLKKDAAFGIDDENLFYNNNTVAFGGSFGYALSGTQIVFAPSNLTWGNYNIIADDDNGTLTVEKLPITVTVKNQTVTYFDNANIKNLMGLGEGFTVEYPASSYISDGRADTAIIFESGKDPSGNFGAIFSITSNASSKGATDGAILADGTTNNVGYYPIKVEAKTENAANYTVIVKGENASVGQAAPATIANAYQITNATLKDVATLGDDSHNYDETDWTPHAGNMPAKFATAVDGADVVVYFAYSLTGTQPADITGASMPEFIDAGRYTVYYRITAKNHKDEISSFVATVNKVGNSFTTAFDYAGKVATAFANGMSEAWAYGLQNIDGNKITMPQTVFNRIPSQSTANGFKVKVYYREIISGAETLFIEEKSFAYDDNAALLAILGDVQNFNAGYYRIVFTMEGNGNYEDAESVGFFRIAKKVITITPNSGSTVYGENFVDNNGIANYGDFAYGQDENTLIDGKTIAGMAFSWVAVWADQSKTYTAGDNATNDSAQYIIRIDGYDEARAEDKTYKYYNLNYEVKFVTSAFTVNKRTVLITISDASNFFNRYSNNATEAAAELKSLVLPRSPYDYFVRNGVKEQPIKLHTNAFDKPVANSLTNNAGKYAIYAKFVDDTFANNYEIKFGGCTWRDGLEGAQETFADCVGAIKDADGENSAGTFEIKSAILLVQAVLKEGNLVYNGESKVYIPRFGQGEISNVQFAVEYYKNDGASDSNVIRGEKLDYVPVDAGRYIANLVYSGSDNNYTAYTLDTAFTITPAHVDVSFASNPWIAYGTAKPTQSQYFAGIPHYFSGYDVKFELASGYSVKDFNDKSAGWSTSAALQFAVDYRSDMAVGTSGLVVTISGFSHNNYIFTYKSGTLDIVARKINVTVKGVNNGNAGARKEYTGTEFRTVPFTQADFNSYFTITAPDGRNNWWGETVKNGFELGFTLPLINAKDAGFYAVDLTSITWSDKNFDVTFANYNNKDSEFEIYKKALTVYVVGIDQAVYNQDNNLPLTQNWQVTFGNGIRVNYAISGFVVGENYDSIKATGKTSGELKLTVANFYLPWQNEVGKHNVTYKTESDLSFDNYSVTYAECQFEVIPRQISIKTENGFIDQKTYTEIVGSDGKINYNNGVYGARQDASIVFVNQSVGSVDFYDNANDYKLPLLNNGYTLAYTGVNTAPDRAGDYKVKVTLSTKNYRFEGNSTVSAGNDYRINRKEMPLAWDMANITEFDQKTEEERVRYVGGFIDGIMNVTSFIRSYQGTDQMIDESVPLLGNGATGNGYYKIEGVGIKFTAYATGEYRVSISISTAARSNYVIPNGTNDFSITLNLVVTQDGITFNSVSIGENGWVYNQYSDTKNAPKAVYDVSNESGITFMYAKLNNAFDYQFTGDEAKFNTMFLVDSLGELTHTSGSALSNGNFSMTMPSTVGLYVLRAYHGATGQSAYAIFRISPAQVELPDFSTETTYTYNGSVLEVIWNVSADVKQNIIVSEQDNRCYVNSVEDGLLIREKIAQAGTYTIEVRLADTENFRLVGNSSFTWTIGKATESILSIEEVNRVYSGNNDYPIKVITRFGSSVNSYYISKTAGSDPTAISSGWSTSKPVGYGEYWVRVSTADSYSNWNATTGYGTISITKAVLTAAPSASVVYGTIFDRNGNYRVSYSGYVGGDDDGNARPRGTVEFDIVGEDGNPVSGLNYLTAPLSVGTYYLKANVAGLTSDNYSISAELGSFTVTPKALSVIINPLSSVYGDEVDLTRATFNITGDSVSASALGISLQLVGVISYENLAADSYTIVATGYTNSNYSIAFTPGTYTVTRRQITISNMNNGGGTVGNVLSPTVNTVTDLHTNTQISGASGTFTFEYTYTNQSGQPTGNGGKDKPSAVGTYYVHVAQNNGNYELVGQTAFVFEVGRLIINGSLIEVSPAQYINGAVQPQINFGSYDRNDFIISYEGDCINAGTATVVLTIKDTVNRRWLSTEDASYRINFTITQGTNELNYLTIAGWTYGNYDANVNAPRASAKFGEASEYIFTYYVLSGQTYQALDRRPDEVGTYYVTVTVPQSRNYATFVSEYRQFEISKATREVPTLGIITEGEGKNDVYTGSALQAFVNGFDSSAMEINYDGISNINGNTLSVFATNAGEYKIILILKDTKNYRWAAGDDRVELTWNVARKQVEAPSANTSLFVVNGQDLVYLPNGFDENTMNISGNTSSYGGVFEVTVTLKDTANYEWANGSDGAYVFSWQIVGGETVFTIVASAVGVLAAAAGTVALTQFLLYKKRMVKKADGAATQTDNKDKE